MNDSEHTDAFFLSTLKMYTMGELFSIFTTEEIDVLLRIMKDAVPTVLFPGSVLREYYDIEMRMGFVFLVTKVDDTQLLNKIKKLTSFQVAVLEEFLTSEDNGYEQIRTQTCSPKQRLQV